MEVMVLSFLQEFAAKQANKISSNKSFGVLIINSIKSNKSGCKTILNMRPVFDANVFLNLKFQGIYAEGLAW